MTKHRRITGFVALALLAAVTTAATLKPRWLSEPSRWKSKADAANVLMDGSAAAPILPSALNADESNSNPKMESLFSRPKTERIELKTYRTKNEARAGVFDYIEGVIRRSVTSVLLTGGISLTDAGGVKGGPTLLTS